MDQNNSRAAAAAGLLALGTWLAPGLDRRAPVSPVRVQAPAQSVIDGVLFRFGDDIVTQSDVRQARLLKLVQPDADSDQAFVDAIVNRRLMLSELKRSPPAEPSDAAIDTRRRQWEARVGTGAAVADALARAGMTEAALRGWLRDDLRMAAYEDQRFGSAADRPREVAAWIVTLRQRAGIR